MDGKTPLLASANIKELRELAWVGDAVLALYARQWILKSEYRAEGIRARIFSRMTSNQFLSSVGEPTRVEAEIAYVYQTQGMEKTFEHIESNLLPVFKKQMTKLKKQNPGKKLEEIL
ncbi:MAG: hypothetical protein AAF984_01365 [Verrucomicrobiota bacterium]